MLAKGVSEDLPTAAFGEVKVSTVGLGAVVDPPGRVKTGMVGSAVVKDRDQVRAGGDDIVGGSDVGPSDEAGRVRRRPLESAIDRGEPEWAVESDHQRKRGGRCACSERLVSDNRAKVMSNIRSGIWTNLSANLTDRIGAGGGVGEVVGDLGEGAVGQS